MPGAYRLKVRELMGSTLGMRGLAALPGEPAGSSARRQPIARAAYGTVEEKDCFMDTQQPDNCACWRWNRGMPVEPSFTYSSHTWLHVLSCTTTGLLSVSLD